MEWFRSAGSQARLNLQRLFPRAGPRQVEPGLNSEQPGGEQPGGELRCLQFGGTSSREASFLFLRDAGPEGWGGVEWERGGGGRVSLNRVTIPCVLCPTPAGPSTWSCSLQCCSWGFLGEGPAWPFLSFPGKPQAVLLVHSPHQSHG